MDHAISHLRKYSGTLVILSLALSALLFPACNDKDDKTSPGIAVINNVYKISLDFTRVDSAGLDPFVVTAYLTNNSAPVSGATLAILVGKPSDASIPSVSAVAEPGPGQYRFTVTPDQTGEYPVTVRYGDFSITRTPLVLADVNGGWEQPMSVPGYVNTEGYEDGVTVSPDGEYLFVQTGPMYFSGILQAGFDCSGDRTVEPCASSIWGNNTRGSYSSPDRPGFFTGRINTSNNTLRHNSSLWQVPDGGAPIFAPITLFYGFKRQSDGSFKEPFYLAFDDLNDAIINPFGMSFKMNGAGSATMIFALQDTTTNGFDVYTADITLGRNNSLGTYTTGTNPGDPPVRDAGNFASRPVSFGDTDGTQGNPHLFYLPDGTIHSIWTDDEYDSAVDAYGDYHDITVYLLDSGAFPDGVWTRFTLPSLINDASDQIQPFFTGKGLFFTQGTEIFTSDYNGAYTRADLENSANWSAPVRILAKDDSLAVGTILAIGEPTLANYNGEEYLYFVYGYVREKNQAYIDAGYGISYDFDMQAGFIKKR